MSTEDARIRRDLYLGRPRDLIVAKYSQQRRQGSAKDTAQALNSLQEGQILEHANLETVMEVEVEAEAGYVFAQGQTCIRRRRAG